MQISGYTVSTPLISPNQRPDITERTQKDIRRETPEAEPAKSSPQQASLDEASASYTEFVQQRVESPGASSNVNSQRSASDENLPLNTQRALKTFADNTPSAEQRLGIELVGVDTYA